MLYLFINPFFMLAICYNYLSFVKVKIEIEVISYDNKK